MDTQLPNHRYGLFVDGVSIFEFFTAGHIDAETTYSSFYSQHRTGFKSSFEARVASSVQNLFPSVFGKSDSNIDMTEALPALPTPAKWDSNDGNTGLCYQILHNMADVELQFQETITTVLGDYLEAQHIARECLHHSKRFALELCQFITLDYQKWKYHGHSQKDAWKMTSVCVRRIFEELYSERVVAHVYDQGNPSFNTSKYLWATWRAHAVMGKYLRHQFYEHPSISAVLARHLADNYVKPDDAQGTKIKALEAQVKQLEATQKTLQSRYDALQVEKDRDREKEKDRDGKLKTGGTPLQLGAGEPHRFFPSPAFSVCGQKEASGCLVAVYRGHRLVARLAFSTANAWVPLLPLIGAGSVSPLVAFPATAPCWLSGFTVFRHCAGQFHSVCLWTGIFGGRDLPG